MSNDVPDAVQSIIEQIEETDPAPRRQIKQIIQFCGVEFAQAILEETLRIEALVRPRKRVKPRFSRSSIGKTG